MAWDERCEQIMPHERMYFIDTLATVEEHRQRAGDAWQPRNARMLSFGRNPAGTRLVAVDTTAALGAQQIAGAFVNPKGMAKKMTAAVAGGAIGGAIGAMAAGMAAGNAYAGTPAVPNFGRVGYVAATADEIALIRTKSGLLRMKVTDEVLVRAPRTSIASIDLDQGMLLSRLKIAFNDGVTWELDVPKANKKGAQELVRALGGTLS